MSVLSNVTVKTLKKNRVRTLVTIIGIILSTAMFTAVASIVSSLYSFMVRGEIAFTGNYHVRINHCDGGRINSVSGDERIIMNAYARHLGYADIGSENEDKPYVCVLGANDSFFENMPVNIIEGRLPENEDEIVVPEHLDYNGGVKLRVGERVSFKLGVRRADEETLYQDSSFFEQGESLIEETTGEYTVVGVYKRPSFEAFTAPGYTVLTRKNGVEADGVYDYYFKVSSPAKNLESVFEDNGIDYDGINLNNELLMIEGNITNNSILTTFISMAAVVCVLIFAGSVSLIYSAFAISVSERTKQFGILSSVGATRKQLRSAVFHEALLLAVIAIPIGIAAGLLGTGVTLYLLKDTVAATTTNSLDGIDLRLSVNAYALIAAAALSFVTVLVSAWIPSKRAMRVSPIEAVRQTRDVSSKGREVRTSKLFLKLFGAEGMLAKNYYKRSRKKYRATVFSLAMSLVLFIGASSFSMFLKKGMTAADAVNGGSNYDLCYFYEMSLSEFETVRAELEAFADEVNANSYYGGEAFFMVDDNAYTDEFIQARESRKTGDERKTLFRPNADVYYIDDASFEWLVKQNGLDMNALSGENGAVLAANTCRLVEFKNGRIDKISTFGILNNSVKSIRLAFCDDYYKAAVTEAHWSGDEFGSGELVAISIYKNAHGEFDLEYDEQRRPIGGVRTVLNFESVNIGALLNESPLGIRKTTEGKLQLLYPMSADQGGEKEGKVAVYMRCADTQEAAKEFKAVLGAHSMEFNPSALYDAHENNRMMENVLTFVNVFTYGFIALITLISAANAFNTITTNVALRRRDYAMLRSMGMTKRGMNRMMNYECLLYGSRALLFGLPIALAFTYLIYRAVGNLAVMPFVLPWKAIIIAVVSIFIVVFASMFYQTGKIKKDNPIDALRNENI